MRRAEPAAPLRCVAPAGPGDAEPLRTTSRPAECTQYHPWFSLPSYFRSGRTFIRSPPGGRSAAFLRRKGCLKHAQLSCRANSPTMFRTIGATRAAGLSRAWRARAPRRATGSARPAANGRASRHGKSIIRRHDEQPIPRPRRHRGRPRVRRTVRGPGRRRCDGPARPRRHARRIHGRPARRCAAPLRRLGDRRRAVLRHVRDLPRQHDRLRVAERIWAEPAKHRFQAAAGLGIHRDVRRRDVSRQPCRPHRAAQGVPVDARLVQRVFADRRVLRERRHAGS